MANSFYYGYLSDTVTDLRKKIAGYKNEHGVFVKGIVRDEQEKAIVENKVPNSPEIQSRIYARILEEAGSELEKIKKGFFTVPLVREPILMKYTMEMVERTAHRTGLDYSTFLSVTAINTSGGGILTKNTPSHGKYFMEKEVEERLAKDEEESLVWREKAGLINTQTRRGKARLEGLISEFNEKFIIPFFKDPGEVKTLYTSMNMGFHDNTTKEPDYANLVPLISARVKRNIRELHKFILVILGLEDPYYDGIGTIQIVPPGMLIDQINDVIASSDKSHLTTRIKGLIRDGKPVDSRYTAKEIESAKTDRKLMRTILSDYALWDRVAAEQDDIVRRLKSEPPTKPLSTHDKNALLTGVWIRHDVEKMHVSTILFTPKMHKYYKIGPVSHTQYEGDREIDRITKLETAMVYDVATRLEEEVLKDMFKIPLLK